MKRHRPAKAQLNLVLSNNLPASSPSPFRLNETSHEYCVTRPVTEDEVIAMSFEILEARVQRGESFKSSETSKNYFIARLAELEQEVFACIFLDNRHRKIAYEELFFGTIDSCSVHPRGIVRRVLLRNAAAVILGHNHPSGVPEPSRADEKITTEVKSALALIDVRVLDHIVVGAGSAVSLNERGLL